jgi:N-acetylglutamate synthase-like GNAT family acetyltransferase
MDAALELRRFEGQPAEWAVFTLALAQAKLPTDDLLDTGQEYYALIEQGVAVAFGGFARHGSDALLRSIIVPATQRGRGHGRAVVEALLGRLREMQVARAWLLTEKPTFFAHLGFETKPRSAAPASITATKEFAALCPASASLMTLTCSP